MISTTSMKRNILTGSVSIAVDWRSVVTRLTLEDLDDIETGCRTSVIVDRGTMGARTF
jgi:hypothetical protein